MLFPFGFYKKGLEILYFNQKFSMQPLTVFQHNKAQKERVSTDSIDYQIPSLVKNLKEIKERLLLCQF